MQRSPSPDSKLSPWQKAGIALLIASPVLIIFVPVVILMPIYGLAGSDLPIVQVEQRLAAAASLLSVVFVAGVGCFIAGLILLIGSKKGRSRR